MLQPIGSPFCEKTVFSNDIYMFWKLTVRRPENIALDEMQDWFIDSIYGAADGFL